MSRFWSGVIVGDPVDASVTRRLLAALAVLALLWAGVAWAI
ncbi:hypothetical protein [Sphaerotilus mobilis]|uniref:Uncharacterized protein n=1 Tax=Sphaerotilus mobilis TaxID=47994 RepID=A0A4Q7LHK4_9BURK|nr:hypothetical protein [Sphaerotilus mobilis]RZS53217.1 hypothetical protein EV685_2844 [Sphaerotilus mobilis]